MYFSSMQPDNCLNCGASISTTNRFCPNCGQKTELHRLSLHEVAHDAIHYFTHADKGIFSLIKDLALKPGRAAREFVQGQRKKHFPPLNFILIVAGLCLLMTALLYPYEQQAARRAYASSANTTQANNAERYTPAQAKRGANIGKFFAKYSNLVTIAAVPFFSFVCWLLYRRGRYNYTEHLVGNMYLAGFVLILYAFLVKPAQLLFPPSKGFYAVAVYLVFETVYRTIFYYYFVNTRTRAAVVKSILASLVVIGLWSAIVGVSIRLYITNGFWGLLA